MNPDEMLNAPDPGHEVGLHFMCFNANIANQFQFIQANWAGSEKFENFYSDPDPLIGAEDSTLEGQPQTFTIRASPVRKTVTGLKRFAEVRGGAYLFMPGIQAIKFLASIRDPMNPPNPPVPPTPPAPPVSPTPTPAPTPAPSGFLSDYAALANSGLAPADVAKAQYQLLAGWLATKPGPLFAELRAAQPVFVPALGPVLVTRFRDVLEALGLEDVFTVKPAADAIKIIVGDHPFLLGMDDSAARDNDQAILRLAVKRTDADTIRAFIAAGCKEITDAAAAQGQLDLVRDYTSAVPLRLAGQYFGIPGPDIPTLGRWLRAMFRATFRNPGRDPQVDADGAAAATEYRAYVATVVDDARRNPSGADTVVSRLLAMECNPQSSFDDAGIVHNLSSLLMGMIDTTNAAVNFAIDSLLNRPAELAGAAAAAGAGDDALLLRYIFEAMRFNPPVPLLARFSISGQLLAKGTDHATLVPANRLVYVATGSAMMDETELDNPLEFRLDRPDTNYLHLGWGTHRCFGRHVAKVLMGEMVKNLLLLKNLRRAPGDAGHLQFDGPFLKSFTVGFDVCDG